MQVTSHWPQEDHLRVANRLIEQLCPKYAASRPKTSRKALGSELADDAVSCMHLVWPKCTQTNTEALYARRPSRGDGRLTSDGRRGPWAWGTRRSLLNGSDLHARAQQLPHQQMRHANNDSRVMEAVQAHGSCLSQSQSSLVAPTHHSPLPRPCTLAKEKFRTQHQPREERQAKDRALISLHPEAVGWRKFVYAKVRILGVALNFLFLKGT